ncbi:MAG TPA: helix-hairpin-helix domain-containing protein [candidate division WOR-3 bacterium]|uniref:Helix-hairpin-helix domain-containing protein n=1 Tax=candidate division WOR-3 bacterium TaxID=2052148 RepID=A0A9C9JZE3_UNCW3|nr:helix-hairpin-helix domain-containing protein [candidate division WOR-3 bacterium]
MFLFIFLISILDINRAPLNDFFKLPVDSTIARRIYEYRELYGNFTSIYELRKIEGIDGELFEKLKPLIKVTVPFPERSEWASIINEQKKLAREEPPSKAAIDKWEELLRTPIYINEATFEQLVMLDRMTPIDAAAVIKHLNRRPIHTSRDLRQTKFLSHYAYGSLKRYLTFKKSPLPTKPVGSLRLKLDNQNCLDIGEENNSATRISYLESALEDINDTKTVLKTRYDWSEEDCQILENRLIEELDTLKNTTAGPSITCRLKANYRKRLRFGLLYGENNGSCKGYIGLENMGFINHFYLGNYRIIWGEGLMIDNCGEYRARLYSRSTGLFGDLTEKNAYELMGAAGDFSLQLSRPMLGGIELQPSFFYSTTVRDAVVNPNQTIWRVCPVSSPYREFHDQVNEETYGASLKFLPFKEKNPGTTVGIEALTTIYNKSFDPDVRWVDIPFDKYDPVFYPEITALSNDSTRSFYGFTFLLPVANTFVSGEYVRQYNTHKPANAYLVKGRIQYNYLFLNLLFRHYDVDYDAPFNRGFSEYRRFDDTPFEKPYALVDPEYVTVYEDPCPKPEEGVYLEMRYQLTRNITITRAYIDIFKNLAHNLNNRRLFFEFELQPVWKVRIRFSQKNIYKHLPKPINPSVSNTDESTVKVFFLLSDLDALRLETRYGNVDLTATDGDDLTLNGGFLACTYTHNIIKSFTLEGGIAAWWTDGMSQWIFEDVGIDFLDGYGMKYYIVTTQKVGDILLRLKLSQKFTRIPHTGLYNDAGIYYPDMPGIPVDDFTNNEHLTKVNLQIEYFF